MATTRGNQALAAALRKLKRIQEKNRGVVEHSDLENTERAMLVDAGFLRPVIRGWYVCANPAETLGDSTQWYATYWTFLSGFLGKRFGKDYCLNPEASIFLHTGNTVIPRQIVVAIGHGGANNYELPFSTSLMVYPAPKSVPASRVETKGLQTYSLAEALCRIGPQFFKSSPREAEIALTMVRNANELLPILLDGETLPTSAARLAGAFQFMGRAPDANMIVSAFARLPAGARTNIQPINPFEQTQPTLLATRERSPYALRIRSLWASWRETVIATFPPAPGLSQESTGYLRAVEDRYAADAYNSLSIEGYRVTDTLIEQVAGGEWSPDTDSAQATTRDTLAARGYYQAFQSVKASIARVLEGESVGEVIRSDHHEWYAQLFDPSVQAGILNRSQLMGYRTGPIFIRNSMHTPVPREAILDSLEALFDLISTEPEASVRAVLGHHLFVFIHPYYDGNGRTGRFLMNALLASGGYPWTVIRVERRTQYMQALEAASVKGDIQPLVQFVAEEMQAW